MTIPKHEDYMSKLFSPLKIRGIEFKNRIAVSPMCQYSSLDGFPTDWHLVHLGSRAVGGAALVMQEATAVSPEGRISPDDAGIWSESHSESYKKITSFIKSQNAIPGIQLAHAGRKASTYSPWKGRGEIKIEDGGWQTFAPNAEQFSKNYTVPVEMSLNDITKVINDFKTAAKLSVEAGFQVIEIHMAHGYLVHEFLSPLSNQRKDEYGGSLENRCKMANEIAKAIRNVIPDFMPLFVRISSTDWIEGGWDIEQSVIFARGLKEIGVDLIDCSSGGNIEKAKIPVGPGYQVPFSTRIKKDVNILTGGVGLITSAEQAEEIISNGNADIVFLARAMLRDPYWAIHAAKELNVDIEFPKQYLRAK
jgi:2,4-dienoyl-CoA reductase-like NADH-dependent reductase (Old Yellow Enzyme family)